MAICFRRYAACSALALIACAVLCMNYATAAEQPDAPIAIRAEMLTVPPATQPLASVAVKNLGDTPYAGSISLKGPPTWRIAPPQRDVELAPGETRRVPFAIERGVNLEANTYPLEVTATGMASHKQTVFCASAPYFKPTIDGDPSEWKDAIPVTFTSGGRKTVVSTYWNRRQFSLLVAVEEEALVRPGSAETFDAVQFALSSLETTTGTKPDDEAARFEFLLTAADKNQGKCYQLASPETKLADAAKARTLGPLEYDDATLAVRRTGTTTYYECGIPFTPMRDDIRPSEGREFFFSVLVHDPDGTGVRDLGQAAGLWPSQRNALAWSRWQGARWGEKPPFDNKVNWGLSSSKY